MESKVAFKKGIATTEDAVNRQQWRKEPEIQ